MLQIDALAQYFASNSIQFNNIFSSDLTRARLTAEGICRLQSHTEGKSSLTPKLETLLREKDFGSKEGRPIQSAQTTQQNNKSFLVGAKESYTTSSNDAETMPDMRYRARTFLSQHIIPRLFDEAYLQETIAIVSHGVFMLALWNSLVEFFDRDQVRICLGNVATQSSPIFDFTPSWSNTGFMEVLIQPSQARGVHCPPNPSPSYLRAEHEAKPDDFHLHGLALMVKAANSREHLVGLKRTRGGIGSAAHDGRQRKLDQFFKK